MQKKTTLLIILALASTMLFGQKNKKQIKEIAPVEVTGEQDRTYWSSLLYKIASPVILNLANGTLKKNMPAERRQYMH